MSEEREALRAIRRVLALGKYHANIGDMQKAYDKAQQIARDALMRQGGVSPGVKNSLIGRYGRAGAQMVKLFYANEWERARAIERFKDYEPSDEVMERARRLLRGRPLNDPDEKEKPNG